MSALPVSARLLLSYLLVAVLPLGGLAAFHLATFEAALRETVLANLAIIADKKADQIDSYDERLKDSRQLSRHELIRNGRLAGAGFRTGGPMPPPIRPRRAGCGCPGVHRCGGVFTTRR
jgi:hypothetical protein